MKIVFTHGYFLEEDEKEKEIMRPYAPLGILYLSAYLEENGFDNEVFDSTFSSFEKLRRYLLDEKPDLLAIYTNLMTKLNVLKIIRLVRSEHVLKKTKIVLGGPEVRHHAANFLLSGADVIVIGEGEDTLLELVKSFPQNKSFDLNTAGIAYSDEKNSVRYTAERTLIRDVNSLPFPNRKKTDLRLYARAWKEKHGYSMYSVSTMRGCPYTCKWCSRAVYGGTYRRRNPGLVADELLLLKKEYNPDRIWFVDDVFTISHKWLKEFAEQVKKKNALIPYEIITRADRMNEEVVKMLKESGCFRVWIGAESGSQAVIDAMDRRVDVKQVRDMIRLTRKHGMEAGTFIMLGYPGETKQDIKETIGHLQDSNPDFYTITIAYPIKGTPLYEEVQDTFTVTPEWKNSTDRDLDFKRKYPRKFYEYALRWVYNEVQLKKEKNPVKQSIHKLKSLAAEGGMWLSAIGGK